MQNLRDQTNLFLAVAMQKERPKKKSGTERDRDRRTGGAGRLAQASGL